MARDIAINSDRRTEYNIRGDLENATGTDFLTQQVFVGIYETVDMSPPQLIDVEIEEQRGDIEQAIVQNEFTEQPISVTVETVDYENQTIQYSLSTNRINETIVAE